jgi:acyl-CoA thioester hydrolase
MPPTHTATFRVRHYECDAYGHVNNANYLRYMQEAAFDASEAVGWGFARYEAAGYQWLAYETDIEYLQPLRYGDLLEIKTWVADWRRVRSLRMYEMRKIGESELVARGQTDWVFLDAKTGYPIAITPEIVAAYSDGEVVEQAPPRKRATPAPPPPPGVFTHRRRVEWRDIDTAQHVNNAAYLNYLEECTILAGEAHGWPVTRSRGEGFAIIARQHHIEYKQPATLGDEIEVATWASDVKNFSATRHYTITRASDGKLLVTANTQWVWVDLATNRLMRIPAHFLADFAANVVEVGE